MKLSIALLAAPALAFIDYLLDPEIQVRLADAMGTGPVNTTAELPQELAETRDTRIMGQLLGLSPFEAGLRISLQKLLQTLVGIDDHRAERIRPRRGIVC